MAARRTFGDARAEPAAEIHIHDRQALVKLLLGGETGGGEAYMDGLWSSPDLAGLLRWAALNRELARPVDRLVPRAGPAPPDDRPSAATQHKRPEPQRNIAAHYDLGNDFYRTFLDETMTYSSAVFATPDQSLADAQRNKYRRMAEGAGLVRGQHVLEIGTGWGGFALYAAGELGCRVTSITISQEQHDLARERVRAAGLEHLVDVQLRDYRDITGTYDAIVSIEMLEAVGAEYFETLLRDLRCARSCPAAGSASSRSPSRTPPTSGSSAARTGSRRTSSRAACARPLPSSSGPPATPRLLIRSVTDIAADYVLTLRAWRTRFMDQAGDGPRDGLRRPVHPDVGVLPRAERGGLRDRASARTCRSCSRSDAGSRPPAPA